MFAKRHGARHARVLGQLPEVVPGVDAAGALYQMVQDCMAVLNIGQRGMRVSQALARFGTAYQIKHGRLVVAVDIGVEIPRQGQRAYTLYRRTTGNGPVVIDIVPNYITGGGWQDEIGRRWAMHQLLVANMVGGQRAQFNRLGWAVAL